MKTLIPIDSIDGAALTDMILELYKDRLIVPGPDGVDISLMKVCKIEVDGEVMLSITIPDGILTEKELFTIIEKYKISLEKPPLPEPVLSLYEIALKRFLNLGFSEEEIALFLQK